MSDVKTLVLRQASIYEENRTIDNGVLVIEGEKISYVGSEELAGSYEELILPPSYKIIPGMIDIHIHGANGADMMDATKASIDTIAAYLPQEGTTSFLATTITQADGAIEAALENVATYENSRYAEVLGVHLEGPFINADMAGAQPREHISEIDVEKFKRWQELSGNNIKLVTFAPELAGGEGFARYLADTGVVASVGHSNALFAEVKQAADLGLSHATHLFNQMRGLHHREPGVVGAAFLLKEVTAELIVDGLHVSPDVVKLSYEMIGSERLILITDAIRAKGCIDGVYDLGGQSVTVENGKAVLADGTLAGSVLTMNAAVKQMLIYTGCSLRDIVKMTAENPAKKLGVFDRKGSIALGKDADLVVLNEADDVIMTFCRGQLVFQKEEGDLCEG
ncbi:N-acetylglucosamine-6-phosphate deacetylase [Anaerobacillus alkaliphilus]|uniref:N-acetylglucosamine-6-phosphate deacetylase n=1 Tax=Anaerobacillus alkaliphilus TaxID=1548597 RepID=A0A4Q0VV26_9BACI|nr:N-acetylglucosamine-6-phosphate deacetylase [Anaerobacillus alkaliphilus]RXJ02176.1 N-acetylglucosamine-6-phosphate deacetylase [Anaerobacillus alkaliphilus]